MPVWFTVYCPRSVDDVTVADLLAASRRWDNHTAAAGFGIEDEATVDRPVASLEVEPASEPEGVRFRLSYGPTGGWPILVQVYADPKVLAGEREEAEGLLGGAIGGGVDRVRKHLGRVGQVELGWSQLKDMGAVFAGMVAEYLAAARAGLLQGPHDDWWANEGPSPMLLAGPA